jgi:hypothetical protein
MSWRVRTGVVCAVGLLLSGVVSSPARAQEPRGGSRTAHDRGQYVLRSAANGTYVYREPGFSASVAADGTVTFHEPNWTPQSKTYEILTNGGKGWSDVVANHGRGWDEQLTKPEAWPVPLPAETRPTLYDLREQRPDPMRPEIPVAVPIFADAGLRADLTDQYTRLMGGDPYGPQKAAFLAGTFDARMKMAAQHHRDTMNAALDGLSRELEAIWNDTRFSPAERSHIVYLLWQDTSANDPDGLRARRVIQDFARRNLPPDEAAWFTGGGDDRR